MAFGERLGGLGTLHTAAPPPHFPILAFHCWIGFQLNNTYIVHECVNIKQQWSKSTDKYVLDYSEVLHLRQPICDQKNETPKKTQLRPPRTPPRLRHNHQPTITQKPNQPPPTNPHPTPTPNPHSTRSPPKPVPAKAGTQGRCAARDPFPHPPQGRREPRAGARRGASPSPIAREPPKSVRPEPVEGPPPPTPSSAVPAHPTVVPAKAGTQGRCAARGVPVLAPPQPPRYPPPMEQHTTSTLAPKRPSTAGSASTTTCASAPDSRRLFVHEPLAPTPTPALPS